MLIFPSIPNFGVDFVAGVNSLALELNCDLDKEEVSSPAAEGPAGGVEVEVEGGGMSSVGGGVPLSVAKSPLICSNWFIMVVSGVKSSNLPILASNCSNIPSLDFVEDLASGFV